MVPWITRLLVVLAAITHGTANMVTTIITTKPGCQRQCGNLTIPYPFGIGFDKGCSINDWYGIECDMSVSPPRAFLGDTKAEILEISETHVKIKNAVAETCYNNTQGIGYINLRSSAPFTVSYTLNAFFSTGCDTLSLFYKDLVSLSSGGCQTRCSSKEDVIAGRCSGVGCCKTDVTKGVKGFMVGVSSIANHTRVSSYSPCSYAFLAEVDSFTFQGLTDLSDPTFRNRTVNVPIALDWNVGNGSTCIQAQAKQNLSSYACQQNTNCTDVDLVSGGYRCSCLPGYDGNPYLSPGCADVDECAAPINPCVQTNTCKNKPGDFECSCSKDQHGDGRINGTACVPDTPSGKKTQLAVKIGLGTSVGLLLVFICISWIYFTVRKRKILKMREKFFEQNGGLLLKQQLDTNQGNDESQKVFTATELKSSTNNYSEDCILGQGGFGTVYKGVLADNRVVAIKKSKISDQTQIEQFINEVVILTKINHRNVVKLLGCCLETEVPLLVYEYVSNGTLYDHIRKEGVSSWLTWENCVRIASEAADALSYLHSAASIPIIHRDIKTANILIDDSYVAKIADFGISRLIPLDQTKVVTAVQGTMGYLDPEYFQTHQLTGKSDVYSFGVLLAELMTRQKPFSMLRKTEDKTLAYYFLMVLDEGRILEIVHPDLFKKADREQLLCMANLIKSCLSAKGDDRPTMKEVAIELEGLKKQIIKHTKVEESTSFVDQPHEDLYPVNASFQSMTDDSELYNSIKIDTLMKMNHPR